MKKIWKKLLVYSLVGMLLFNALSDMGPWKMRVHAANAMTISTAVEWEEAIDIVNKGDVDQITLGGDFTLTNPTYLYSNLTLNLNGHTISYTVLPGNEKGDIGLYSSNGMLTVNNSSAQGGIQSAGTCITQSYSANGGGSLQITGGNYTTTSDYMPAVLIKEYQQVSITGGAFRAASEAIRIDNIAPGTTAATVQTTVFGASHLSNLTMNEISADTSGSIALDSEVTVFTGAYDTRVEASALSIPSGYTYGDGQGNTYSITLSNKGNVDISIGNITVSDNLTGAMYAIDKDIMANGGGLRAGQELQISVNFNNTLAAGSFTGTITIGYTSEAVDAGGKKIAGTATSAVNVTVAKRPIKVGAFKLAQTDKEYDGTTELGSTSIDALEGIYGNDDVTVIGTTAYDTADAGTDKQIIVSLTLDGKNKDNYTLEQESIVYQIPGTITRAAGAGSVSITGWKEGQSANQPVPVSDKNGIAAVTYEYKQADEADTAYTATVPSVSGSYILRATFPETTNYTEAIATAAFEIGAKVLQPDVLYTLSGTKGSNGWYISDVTVVPSSGYQISSDRTTGYADRMTLSQTTAAHTIYFKDSIGAITEVSLPEIRIDKTKPVFQTTDGICVQQRKWKTLLTSVAFDLFLTNDENVTIAATDPESAIDEIAYLISEEVKTLNQLEKETGWIVGNSFQLQSGIRQNNIIYARIRNKAGLTSYISSDGIVYDTKAPVIDGAANRREYYDDNMKVTIQDDYLRRVTLDGKDITVKGNSVTISVEATNMQHVLQAEDATGNVTKITFTVYESWMRDGINESGVRNLTAGVRYYLGSGTWSISKGAEPLEENVTFTGANHFYAVESGTYYFDKQ